MDRQTEFSGRSGWIDECLAVSGGWAAAAGDSLQWRLEESSYDDANRRVTRVFYSAAASPLATNVMEMDRRGNVVKSIDAEFFVSTNLFDGLDRIKVAAGPTTTNVDLLTPGCPCTNFVQEVRKQVYDASGQTLISSNALGEKITTTRDALRRPTLVETRDAAGNLVRSMQTVYATNHHGYTVYEGTGTNAIARTYFTDTEGHSVLALQYPASGVGQYVWQGFDVAGNNTEQREYSSTNGNIVLWATNLMSYDGLDRLRKSIEGDGAPTTFDYDAASDLTNRIVPGGLTWQATYNNARQRTKEFDLGAGAVGANTNTYSYYSSSSPYAGLLNTRTDGRGVTTTVTYDDWLRAATSTTVGTTNHEGSSRTFSYTARGLMTSLSESFASSNTGPTTVVQQTHDANGSITKELITVGGVLMSSASQTWNGGGRRGGLALNAGNNYANVAYKYGFGWRADGLLASLAASSGNSSYGYTDGGLLNTRTVGSRVTSVLARDGAGRALSVSNNVTGISALSESLTYRGDGLLTADSMVRSDIYVMPNDNRSYAYAAGSRRLIQETLNLSAAVSRTNSYTYDGGQPAGPGVLTRAGESATNGIAWQGATNALLQISSSTSSATRRNASGRINGAATMTVYLDGKPMPVGVVGTGNTNWPNQWRATLEMTPGVHQIQARATHPSGFNASAYSSFTNNYQNEAASDQIDTAGFLRTRTRIAGGQTNGVQALYWDGRGRLWKVTERDASQNGYDLVAVYDGLDRRLRTTETPVTNSTLLTTQAKVVEQYFDPQFEFLEIGAAENGRVTWKIPGPDLNGRYGGLNGIGGLEAYCPGPEFFCPIISDAQGNSHGVYDQQHGGITWYPSRLGAYGPVPAAAPPPFGDGASLDQARASHNRGIDRTGFSWRGARYLDSVTFSFLSPDPLGFAGGSDNLRTSFRGRPTDITDADGRVGKFLYQNLNLASGAGLSGIGASWLKGYASRSENAWLGGGAEVASYILNLDANIGRPASYVNQSLADYDAGGGVNVINRYNPLRAPAQAISGVNLMQGPGFGDQLSGVDRAVDILNTVGLVAGGAAGLMASMERSAVTSVAADTATIAAPGSRVTIGGVQATEIAGRLTPEQMAALQTQQGTEFAQVYLTGPGRNGGGGTYYLIQGNAGTVQIPVGPNVRFISHTHPQTLNGAAVPLQASSADVNVLRVLQQAGSPQRTSLIVPEVGDPFTFRR